MLLDQAPGRIPDGVAPTVTIVEVINPPTPELGMIDVAVAAFNLTGYIMVAALVAGVLCGVLYTWFRSRRAITIIEARGGQHDLFKV